MELETIFNIVSVAVSILFFIASIVARFAKDSKTKANALEVSKRATALIDLLNGAKICMIDTEGNKNFTAEEKHKYCKTLIIDYCIKNDIDYSTYDLDEIIAYFMEIGNKINARPEKTEAVAEEITIIGD